MNWTRTFDILPFQAKTYPQSKALVSREDGEWKSYSTEAAISRINLLSQVLLRLGLQKGDMIMIVPELASATWLCLDLAAQQVGVVVVPFHLTNPEKQFELIVEETEAKICFFERKEHANKFAKDSKKGMEVYLLNEGKNSLSHLVKKHKGENLAAVEAANAEVEEDDLAVIMYTSGTTGIPKGVMLTHKNICSNVRSALTVMPLSDGKRAMSFLPYSHIFERTSLLFYLAAGTNVYFPFDKNTLLEGFQYARPHFFTTVPRILEKMHEQIDQAREDSGFVAKRVIAWALKVGEEYKEGKKLAPWLWTKVQFAKMLVFNKFRQVSGGKTEMIFSGAAYLKPEIGRTLAVAGIKVREGYGMTEASPIITTNRINPGLNKFGTVGLPVPGVEIKIDDPDEDGAGEILARGPNIMKGYFKRPEETASVLTTDGWLRTGDVGRMVHKRFLTITDRKKDIFKTSAGKYVAPSVLENHFKQSTFVEQIMVVGFQKPFITALVKPNFDLLKKWCKKKDIHWTSPQYMVLNIKVKQKIEKEIEKLNEKLPNFQKIREFHLLHQEWTQEAGFLTYTMKLVRPKIIEGFMKEIERMYDG